LLNNDYNVTCNRHRKRKKAASAQTTTAVNLAASLATAERKTLLIDADPQGNSTSGVGIERDRIRKSLYEALIDGAVARTVALPARALPVSRRRPRDTGLVGAELELVNQKARETRMREALRDLRDEYGYVIIDCPPSLGLLTLNMLTAADSVIIPIQCEYYALEGLSQLLNTVKLVQRNFNPALAIEGVLLTMYDARLNLCKQVAEEAKEYFGGRMFNVTIPRNVRLAEAPSFWQTDRVVRRAIDRRQELPGRGAGADSPRRAGRSTSAASRN